MNICFIIPFFYKWSTFSNVRANYEYLRRLGYKVDLFNKNEKPSIDFSNYDLVMLHGSGSFLSNEQYKECISNKVPIWSFGWSDPNIFNETHYEQGSMYFSNDLTLSKMMSYKSNKLHWFYNTACDQRHHYSLNIPKETEILVYGTGKHPVVTNRNETVNKLRNEGFKIKVFGKNWDKHPDTHGFIQGEDLIAEINKAHLLLDLSNEITAWPHRIFEASACGTPVLTINREDTNTMFLVNKEIMLYEDFDDLKVQLKYWLNNKHELRQIGLNAQKRCYKDHDISVRIQELDKLIKEYVK